MMSYKKAIVVISVGLPLVSCASLIKSHTATAKLPKDLKISYTIAQTGDFSIQGDWDLKLVIQYQNETISNQYSIGGRWINSNLYRHPSGNLLLRDEDGGCSEIRLEPLEFVEPPRNCPAITDINANASNLRTDSSNHKDLDSYTTPSINFFSLDYIGSFEEVHHNSRRLRFYDFREKIETKLPFWELN